MKCIFKILSFIMLLLLPYRAFSHQFDIYLLDNSVRHCSYNPSSQELTIDHINIPVKRIETDLSNNEIRKVVFSFVALDSLSESIWDLVSECEIVKMDFCDANNLDFVKRFPCLRVLALKESNEIKNIDGLDFSHNKKLEYLELNHLVMNLTKDVKIPESVKYFVISYSKINSEGYDKIQKGITENTILVIDRAQKANMKKKYLLEENELIKLWRKYQVN